MFIKIVALLCFLVAIRESVVESKKVKFTFYWVAEEKKFEGTGNSNTGIKKCGGGEIKKTTAKFAESLKMECSGLLTDGRIINGGNDGCTCFNVVKAPLGSNDNYLETYVSIATNDIAYGKTVYVKQLDGVVLPNGKRHNGCVRMDDKAWSFGNNHVDFYVFREQNYKHLDEKYRIDNVDIEVKPCKLLNYES